MLTSKYINRTKMNIFLSKNLNKFGTFCPFYVSKIWKQMETMETEKGQKNSKKFVVKKCYYYT